MDIITAAKAEVIASGLGKLTGRRPVVVPISGGRARIEWAESDLPIVRAWFERQVERAGKGEGDVELDLVPVVGPYIARSAVPALLVVLLAGYVLGRLL